MNERLEEYKRQAYERSFGERYSPKVDILVICSIKGSRRALTAIKR